MGRPGSLVLKRPGIALAIFAALVGLLSVIGLGADERLHFRSFEIEGTTSERAEELARERFGESSPLVILLEGPILSAEKQGRKIARGIEAEANADVVGPWSPGVGSGLRPEPDATLLVVRVNEPFEEAAREVVPIVRAEVDAVEAAPVEAAVTGQADIYAGLHEASLDSLRKAELIVAPILLVILLLVFRSPLAALLPLGVGIATIGAAGGVLSLLADPLNLDVVALNTVSMIGLALAVDYSLLIVSRYREELRAGASPKQAALAARARAGRTVLFAGLILVAVMMVAYVIAAGGLLRSAATGVLIATLLSMAGAMFVLPPALLLIGDRIEAYSLRSGEGGGLWAALSSRVLGRPGLAVLLAAVPLVILASPALGLESGPPNARDLPADRVERQDYERLTGAVGPGWAFPYEIVVASGDGPVTDRAELREIARWQTDVAQLDGVNAVFGPGEIRERTKGADELPSQLAGLAKRLSDGSDLAGDLDDFLAGAEELGMRLENASAGAAELTAAIGTGAAGADALASGLGSARGGLTGLEAALATGGELGSGAAEATAAAEQVLAGLELARSRVGSGLPRARGLADGLRDGVGSFRDLRRFAERTERELVDARDALEAMLPTSQADPQYDPALDAVESALEAMTGRDRDTGQFTDPPYAGLPISLQIAQDQLARGARVGSRIAAEARTLENGLGDLAAGEAELASGLAEFAPALAQLNAGVNALDSGLAEIQGGAQSLAIGLDDLGARSAPLAPGLSTIALTVAGENPALEQAQEAAAAATANAKELEAELGRSGAADLGSGYLTLAAVDSAPTAQREASSFSINVDRGGSAARLYVIGDYEAGGDDTETREQLETRADELADATGSDVEIGGPGAVIADFDRVSAERLALLIALSTLIAYIVLVPFLGSFLLPAVAVALNLLTVAATFGVLTLAFQGDSPLGGPGFIDAISLSAISVVVFGLSIDYQVFLLGRMREEHELTGEPDAAIANGIQTTAGVVTGAAAVMVAVFSAFALTDIANIRQLGLGLAVAIAIDATLVRLILLPALVKLLGGRAWPSVKRKRDAARA